MYALNATTGAKIWSYTTGDQILSSPALTNGIVYVGSHDNKVYGFNASTGAYIWSYNFGSSDVQASPAIANGILYIASASGKVCAFDGQAPLQYTLTMNTVGQGTVSPGNRTYLDGTVANLTAIPAAGWVFCRWTGDSSATTNTTSDYEQ